MSFDSHKNFAYSTVATAPSPASSGTSLVVASGDGAKFPAVPFNATVWATGSRPLTSNAEIVRVTNISVDTLTIVRTQESSSARSIVVGDQIAATITTKTLTDIETSVAFQLISDTTLGSDQASVVISSIPQTFVNLMLIIYGKGTTAATETTPYVQFNGDTGANYDSELSYGTSTSPTAAIQTGTSNGARLITMPAANSTRANAAGSAVGYILNYAGTTFEKVISSIGGDSGSAGGFLAGTATSFWRNTAAITSITVLMNPGSIKAGSRITLYGF